MKRAIWALCLICAAQLAGAIAHADTQSPGSSQSLEGFLTQQSVALHFKYTEETYCELANVIDPVYVANGETTLGPGPYASLAELVAALQKALPGLDVSIDKEHADAVHVVDRRLENLPGYFMTQHLTSFSYHDKLVPSSTFDLPAAIGEATRSEVKCGNAASGICYPFAGWDTVVTIDASNTDARSILTDATYPMKHRLGQMWGCGTTRDKSGKIVSWIMFM